jgi:threonine/homoserine/homoserine lactone efflux protein
MEYLVPLLGFALAHILAVASPGPSFLFISHTAATRGRADGVLASFAMGWGGLIWAAAALFGLQAILAQLAWLDLGIRLAGAAYLVYLGIRLMLSRREQPGPAAADAVASDASGAAPATMPAGRWRLFLNALLLQLSNPKVIVFFGSIFAVLLPAGAPPWVGFAALAIVFVNEFWWYALVSVVFSTGPTRRFFDRWKIWINRVAGGVLTLLGIRLALLVR